MQFTETCYPENKIFFLKKKRLISKIKKIKRKNKLRDQIPSKKLTISFLANSKNLFFTNKASPIEIQIKNKLSVFLGFYTNSNETERIFRNTIENTSNEYAYRFFYNKLLAKLHSYQLIDTDRGSNFELSPNTFTRVVGTLLNVFYVVPILVIPGLIASSGQVGLKVASNKRKINKTKNKLDHCIPETNFIKLLSILLTKTHESEFSYQENIDLFLEKTFKNFWSLFKTQAKNNPNREQLNQFWSECLNEYLKELKCPLLQENFYENLNTMTPNSPPIAGSTFQSPEANLQLLFIMHFIKLWLIQLSMQTVIQQTIKCHETPLPSLSYTPTLFFNSERSSQSYRPSYSISPAVLGA